MKGWFRDSYRHYLASKGVKTKLDWRNKYPDLVKDFPGDNPAMTSTQARFRQRDPAEFYPGSFRTKRISPGKLIIVGRSKKTDKYELQSVVFERKYFSMKTPSEWWKEVGGPKRDPEEVFGLKRYKLASISPEQHLSAIDPGDMVKLGFMDGKMQQIWVKVKVFKQDMDSGEFVGIVEESPADPKDIGVDKGDRVVFRKENVIDMVNLVDVPDEKRTGWQDTTREEGAKEYAERNLVSTFKGTPEDRMKSFSGGVKEMAFHPVKDMDGEWLEYSRVAGKPELLSEDRMERSVQRGAALFGRVVTQANVEPISDYKKDRTFREVMMDIEFGRRL